MNTSAAQADATGQLQNGNTKFTTAFFDQLRCEKGNLFFSPLSLEILLAMTLRGARGNTATQIQQIILNDEKPWMETLTSDDHITLNLVNAIFGDISLTIQQYYLNFVKNHWKGELAQVDFADTEEAVKTINEFVAKNTGNKITDLIHSENLKPGSALLLLNAVYFKADWDERFPKSKTHKKIFHLSEQQGKEVDYMTVQSYFKTKIHKDLDARIVEIPYKGDTVAMILVVPETINGLATLESKIASYDLNQLTENMRFNEVILTIPKFKLEKTIDIKSLLIKMGVVDLFDPARADLRAMAEGSPFASNAIQKTYIEVNEEGSEAGAVTAGLMSYCCYQEPTPVLVDRPFLFFLKHKPTDLYLFIGRLASP